MKLLLENITVLSPGSAHHLKQKHLLIDGSTIKSISDQPLTEKADEVMDGTGLYVSCGWMDLHADFCEPGNEHKENLLSGANAAAAGGFTAALIMPSTHPPVADRARAEFIFQRSKSLPIELIPAGALTSKMEGKDISEMYDMYLSGVRVFTDDKKAVQDHGLMIRALQYAHHFGGRIFSFCNDERLAQGGMINEGTSSASLGLKGIPSIAEEVMVAAHLTLSQYSKVPIHFSTISSSGSVHLIREAKAKGVKVTADVAAPYLFFTDEDLSTFDTNLKLFPPLRSSYDRDALIEGLLDGTIDCITSDHRPEDVESKKKEFALAAFGAAGLETTFAVANTVLGERISLPELISRFSNHSRHIAGLKALTIEENNEANLTVFDAHKKWIVKSSDLKSKGINNPFLGKELTGKVIAVFCKGILTKNQ